MYGLITNIQRFSVHDGPGIRTTVFLSHCPLSCAWCHNPETIKGFPEVLHYSDNCIGCKKCIEVCSKNCFSWKDKIEFSSDSCDQCGVCIDNCPVSALKWTSNKYSSDTILDEVMRDKVYFDISGGGITLSGGEPLQQIEFCYDLVSKAKNLGLHVTVDTCGYVPTESLIRIMPLIDLFLYDIKAVNDNLHKKYTGKSNAVILSNFKLLCESARKIIVRVPLIPGKTNRKENLQQITSFVERYNKRIEINKIPFNALAAHKYGMLGRRSHLS